MAAGSKRIPEPTHLVVHPANPTPLVSIIEELHGSRGSTNGGWVNVLPRIPTDVPIPATPGPFAVFSKRGPAVPMASWVVELPRSAGRTAGGVVLPPTVEIGLQHAAARRVAEMLGPIPDGFRVTQDHARRGLVLEAQSVNEVDVETTVDWLLQCLGGLCRVESHGDFDAVVYRRPA
jgi:hypothetical protein